MCTELTPGVRLHAGCIQEKAVLTLKTAQDASDFYSFFDM